MKLWLDAGKVLVHSLPHDFEIDPKVVVDRLVSHSSHELPRQLRMLLSETWRDSFRGFADDFKSTDDSVVRLIIRREFLVGHSLDELPCFPYAKENIFQERRVGSRWAHTGMASL